MTDVISTKKQPLFQREISDPEDKIQETLRALSHETVASVTYQRNIIKLKPRRKSKRAESNSSDLMSPLSFENIEVKNTPLSSMRSCSEYNHNVRLRPTLENETGNNQRAEGFWSRLMFWNRSKKNVQNRKSSIISINEPPKGKKNLRVRFQDLSCESLDERLYLVEKFQFNAANLNEDEIMEYQSIQYVNQRALSSGQQTSATEARQLSAFLDASFQEYQSSCFTAQAISQNCHRRNPRHANGASHRPSIFEESSRAVDYLFGYHSASTHRQQPTSGNADKIRQQQHQQHYNHQQKVMEIELQNLKDPEVIPADQTASKGFPVLFSRTSDHNTSSYSTTQPSTTATMNLRSGFGSGHHCPNGCGLFCLPLSLSRTTTSTSTSTDYHLGVDESHPFDHSYHPSTNSNSNPTTPLASLRRGNSLRSVDRLSSMNSLTSADIFLANGTTISSTQNASMTGSAATATNGPSPTPVHTHHTHDTRTHFFPFCQACYTQMDDQYRIQERMTLFRTWYTHHFPLYSRDFYDALRLQPFSCGAYLRAMLLAGLSSMIFHIYNAITWPVLPAWSMLTITQQTSICFFYTILLIQIVLNVFALPFRLRIHFLCWESSRAIEMDHAMELIHYLLRSDSWLLNTFFGRVLDGLACLSLLLGEGYLLSTGSSCLSFFSTAATSASASVASVPDPLHPLISSLAATNLLAFVCRILIATIFAYTLNDPTTLSEARKRGLTKWDVENLPTFVFTPADEEDMTNTDCSICLMTFELGDMIISLPCDRKHSFHGTCIRQWLMRQNSCPLCQRLV